MKLKILLVSFIGIFFFVLYMWRGMFRVQNSQASEEYIFTIERGESAFDIGGHLEEAELISNKIFFSGYVFWKGEQQKLQAGTYALSPAMNIAKITDTIVNGETATVSIQIPEGWSIYNIADLLEEKRLLMKEDFLKAVESWESFEFSYISIFEDKPDDVGLEGYLFPDTYQVQRGQNAKEIAARMVERLGEQLTQEILEEIERQGKTLFEILTMASLLEKEVKTKEEKELVAGVLWKRLRYGIRLQVDATVYYSIREKPSRLSVAELQIDSPYNTYKYSGLPKGPISNPGMESILAAMYPKESDYLYYLSGSDGTTFFSRTLEEHNIKKAKYIQ